MRFEVRINDENIGPLERSDIERRASAWQKANAKIEIIDPALQSALSLRDFLARPPQVLAQNTAPVVLSQPQSAGLLDQFDSLIPTGHYEVRVSGQLLGVLPAPDILRRANRWNGVSVEVSNPLVGVLSLDAWLKRISARFDPLLWPRMADAREYVFRDSNQGGVQKLSRAEIEWRAALGIIGPMSQVGTGSGPFVALNDFLAGALTPTPPQPHVGPSPQPAPIAQPAPPRATKTILQFGSGPYFVRVSGQILGPLSRADIERRSQGWPSAATEVAENSTGPFVELTEFLRMPAPVLTPTPSLAPISQNFGPGPYYVRIGTAMLGPLQRDDIERRSRAWPVTAEVAEVLAGPFVQISQFLKMPAPAQGPPTVTVQSSSPPSMHEHPATVVALTLITLNFYWLYWLSRTYRRIRQIDPHASKITPGQAWGFLFIPVFGAFWFLRIAFDLPRAVLRLQPSTTSGMRLARGAATIMCIVGSLWVFGVGFAALPAKIAWIAGCEVLFLGFIGYCQSMLNSAKDAAAGVPTGKRPQTVLAGATSFAAICTAVVVYFVLFGPADGSPYVQRAKQFAAAGDFESAVHELEQTDSPIARYELSFLYKNGLGVKRNPQEAVSLMRKAADAGLADAQATLGLWYASGDDVESDPTTAVSWYRKAAAQGNNNAAVLLGLAYATGNGVEQDPEKAAMWFTVAANRGDTYAASEKNVTEKLLDAEQKARAESEAAEEQRSEPGGQSAN